MAQIDDFKANLIGGGARANQFRITVTPPPGIAIGLDVRRASFLVTTASLPAQTLADIPVPFRGRNIYIAGDRTFDTWAVTVINDEDFKLRSSFESWMNGISKLSDASGATNPNSYMGNATVNQLGRSPEGRFGNANSGTGDASGGGAALEPLRTYYFDGIFPTEVSSIDLSYESGDAIEEYTVTFQVQYWIVGSDNSQGTSSDQTGNVIV